MTIPRCAIVTNIPTPYRVPVFRLLPQDRFLVVFSAMNEPNRGWDVPPLDFPHAVLRPNMRALSDGFNFVHNNPDVWAVLSRYRPGVVILTGFNPTHMYAFAWAVVHGARVISMTDGTVVSERGLTWKHRVLRHVLLRNAAACIAASRGGTDLFASYGVPRQSIFRSCLCVDGAAYSNVESERKYDVMFCGQFHERKRPLLFVETCRELLARRGSCRALLVGTGALRDEVLNSLLEHRIDFHYAGFVQPAELPKWYASARVLLFTTRLDAWGLVANEAMAAGTPVITTPDAGAADELVVDGVTGFVRQADAGAWAQAASMLLDDDEFWSEASAAARRQVSVYTPRAAATGIVAACDYAFGSDEVAAESWNEKR